MLNLLCAMLRSRSTTFEKAKAAGEITSEVEVYPSKHIIVCGNGIYEYRDECELENLTHILGGGQIRDI